jgi:hypothetical protein
MFQNIDGKKAVENYCEISVSSHSIKQIKLNPCRPFIMHVISSPQQG